MIVLVDGFLRVLLLGKGIVCMCDVFWLGGWFGCCIMW